MSVYIHLCLQYTDYFPIAVCFSELEYEWLIPRYCHINGAEGLLLMKKETFIIMLLTYPEFIKLDL